MLTEVTKKQVAELSPHQRDILLSLSRGRDKHWIVVHHRDGVRMMALKKNLDSAHHICILSSEFVRNGWQLVKSNASDQIQLTSAALAHLREHDGTAWTLSG